MLGCTDPLACNFDLIANTDDGSCNYSSSSYDTLFSPVNISWNGILLATSGDYSTTLVNSSGCDSVANISFTLIVTGVNDINTPKDRTLIKVTDILGRNIKGFRSGPVFYIYKDFQISL